MATLELGARSTRQHRSTWSGLRWAWLGGAEPSVLALVPTEIGFAIALGRWVAAMGAASGLVMAGAAMQWWNTTFQRVWWIFVGWTFIYWLFERLILKSFSTSWKWNLALAPIRSALAIAVAVVVIPAATQVVFSRSIDNQLSINTVAQVKQSTKTITAFYEPKIAQAEHQQASIRAHETALKRQETHYNFLATCEAGERICSQTHELGCQAYCHRDQQQAAVAKAELAAIKPQDAIAIATLSGNIVSWRADEKRLIATRAKTIEGDKDFLARQHALAQVEKKNGGVRKYVYGFIAFLFVLDVTAICAKLWHVFSGGAAYEKAAAALRDADGVNVYRINKDTEVCKERIRLTAEMQVEIDRARIEGDAIRQIVEEEATWNVQGVA